MKAKNYRQILESRGYKANIVNKYQGTDVYVKEHKYSIITCMVKKDTHGKAQDMWFAITSQIKQDKEIQKRIDSDADFLSIEANKIHNAFEQLKSMKSPKHIYF